MSEPNERQGMPLPSWPLYPPPAGSPPPYQYPAESYPQPSYPQPSYPPRGAGQPFPAPPRLVPGGPRYDPHALPIDDETLARRIAAGTPRYSPSRIFIGAAVVLLAIAVGLGIFLLQGAASRTRVDDAARLASAFCVDEQLGNYADVYQLFSSNMRATISEGDFIATSTLRQRVNGVVRDCATATDTSPANTGAFSGQFVTLTMQITLSDGPHTGTLLLTRQDNTWKIEHMDEGLRLLDTLPLATPTPNPAASPSPTAASAP